MASVFYSDNQYLELFYNIVLIITGLSITVDNFLSGSILMGIIMLAFLVFIMFRFSSKFIATHIFLFNNRDLNKLSDNEREAILKNQGSVVINYWPASRCTYLYFNRFREYKLFKIFFDLPEEFISQKEYIISEGYETVLEKLMKHKIPFNKMNNPVT